MSSSSIPRSRGAFSKFLAAVGKSRFLTISATLHFLLILTFGGTVLFNAYVEPEDVQGQLDFAHDEITVQPPKSDTVQMQTLNAAPVVVANPVQISPILSTSPRLGSMQIPGMPMPSNRLDHGQVPSPSGPVPGGPQEISAEIAQEIIDFTRWTTKPPGPGQGVRDREFVFTAYLAKYSGGNWDSTVRMEDGQISTGSLPNLLYMIRHWSGDRIQATPDPIPLDLASDEIFAVRPPFIFFTGHRDFTLTDREVENLRKYILVGGAIWGDSSLPGQRSRFDIAFRREMRRVVGNIDQDFEILPANHALFDPRSTYFPEVRSLPSGMNHYRQPAYTIKVHGEIAVLYTANDYADLWQIGLDKDGKFDTRRDEHGRYVAMNPGIFHLRETYYRGIDEQALTDAYKFGVNVVLHFLTRWEDRLRTVPRL